MPNLTGDSAGSSRHGRYNCGKTSLMYRPNLPLFGIEFRHHTVEANTREDFE
jgi:hypothetical protein